MSINACKNWKSEELGETGASCYNYIITPSVFKAIQARKSKLTQNINHLVYLLQFEKIANNL